MKFNKWTLGLAAVGVVSLASAVQAEEAANTANTVLTALSSTTLSGYVDTSAQWNFGTGNENNPPYKFGGASKADGFNLNVVQLTIAKPMDESEWAAGYHVDLWFGPDAGTLGTASGYYGNFADFAIRQAYVSLRTPIGNGIDWKMGVFDSIIGYESVASPNDPNFTRSYGHGIEPQTHTGLLGTYRFNDFVSFSAGIANTIGPMINERAQGPNQSQNVGPKAESFKTYMVSLALTAPDSWGWVSGSTLYGGVVNGYNGSRSIDQNQTSWYVGTTLSTPVTGLKFGAAFDYLDIHNRSQHLNNAWSIAGYGSYQATEKLSLHARVEYFEDKTEAFTNPSYDYKYEYPLDYQQGKTFALTGTIQYDLWKNVLSRVEFRWDHSCTGRAEFGNNLSNTGTSGLKNAAMLLANIVYKF